MSGFGSLLVLASCAKREPEPPRPAYAYPYPTQQAPVYSPPAAAPQGPMAAAVGFPCRSDQELQCAFGRCINGRCGGCSGAQDCKAGATCVPTWVGASCWPGAPTVASPGPMPMPAPAPAPVPAPVPVPAPTNPGDPFAAARDRCVTLTNQYRARVGAPPVARDAAGESCADRQSSADARTSAAHGNFGSCNEFAQNTCPNYPGANVDEVMTRCFQQMFDEGPGGGHYDNMTRRKYTKVHCGFAALGGGRFWINQNFK